MLSDDWDKKARDFEFDFNKLEGFIGDNILATYLCWCYYEKFCIVFFHVVLAD